MIKRKLKAKATTKPPIRVLAIMGCGLGIIGIVVGVPNRADKGFADEFDAPCDSGELVEKCFADPVKAVGIEGDGQGNDNERQCNEKVCDHLVLGDYESIIVNGCSPIKGKMNKSSLYLIKWLV